jgi:hypothetical protein
MKEKDLFQPIHYFNEENGIMTIVKNKEQGKYLLLSKKNKIKKRVISFREKKYNTI